MNVLDRLALAITPGIYPFTPSTYEEAYPDHYNGASWISTSRAETVPIAYVCTRVVSEDIAKVALHIFEDLGVDANGRTLGKRKAPDHEWYDALHHEANEFQTAIDFREMMTAFALNRGRGVAKKVRRRVGGTVRRELIPLHPDCIWSDVTDAGDRRWTYNNPLTGKQEKLLPDEVLVLWGPRRKGIPAALRELLAIMAAGQDMHGQAMARGPRHTGVIKRPSKAPKWDDTARQNFREAVDEYMGEGKRAGRPLLLEDDMDWVSTSFSMHDSEFVATAQLENALVCGAYRVPQHKAGLLERSTNNNIQQQATDYVVDCLLAWAVRWEQALLVALLEEPFKAEHNLRSLLRGDPKTAAETHAIYAAIGTELRNEVRDDEGRNPIDGLWDPLAALNMGNVPGTSVAELVGSPALRALFMRHEEPRVISGGPSDHYRALVWDSAGRVVRKEYQALAKIREQSNDDTWPAAVTGFFRDHAEFVTRVMRIPDETAVAYCAARAAHVIESGDLDDPNPVINALTTIVLTPEGAAA